MLFGAHTDSPYFLPVGICVNAYIEGTEVKNSHPCHTLFILKANQEHTDT